MKEILILTILHIVFACEPGYQLNADQQCVPIGCNRFSSHGCRGCETGLQLKYGVCRVAKCLQQKSVGFCHKCENGFLLDSKGLCRPRNSLKFSERSRISSICVKGFEKDEKGFCKVKYCQDFKDNSYNSCKKCVKNYSQKNGFCAAENCQTLNNQLECVRCSPGFILDEKTNLCVDNLKFCSELNQFSGLCQACQEGYVLVAFRACMKFIDGCLEYDFNGCTRCQAGLEVVEGSCKVQNCQHFGNKINECKKCEKDYKLTENKYCRPSLCDVFSEKTWTCNTCFGRFQLSNGVCRTKNCTYFQRNQLVCQHCLHGYELIDGKCLLPHCEDPYAEECEICKEGWMKGHAGQCSQRDCKTYNPQTKECSSCLYTKRLLRGLCVNDNCLYRSGSYCLQCQKQYFLDESGRYCIPYFCDEVNKETGECQKCWNNFEFTETGYCKSKLCLNLQAKEGFVLPQCTQCSEGYEPFDRYCKPQYCSNFSGQKNQCTQCAEGYESYEGICRAKNCLQYSHDKRNCAICSIGYTLDEGKCVIKNCLKEEVQNGVPKCKQCKSGFFVFGEICLPKHCAHYSDDGICSECTQRFSLTDEGLCKRANCITDGSHQCEECQIGYIVGNSGFCLPLGCQTINPSGSGCESCLKGYVKQSHYCVAMDCEEFDEYFACKTCRKGFVFEKGLCIVKSKGFCPEGQQFNPSTVLCEKTKARFCLYSFPQDRKKCVKCKNGYFWKDQQCYSYNFCSKRSYYKGCLQCLPGYESIGGICKPSTSHCKFFNDNGQCHKCEQKYFLTQSKKCFPIHSYCEKLDNDGKCVSCKDKRRTLKSNVCILQSKNCKSYNLNTGNCEECQKLHYLAKEFCKPNPKGCQIANQKGICKKCLQNFISSKGKCHPIIQDCVGYDIFGQCSTCQFGFYITNAGQCKKIPPNCEKMGSNGECEECRRGFGYLGGKCKRTVKFCVKHDENGKCKECKEGYIPSSSGKLCLLAYNG